MKHIRVFFIILIVILIIISLKGNKFSTNTEFFEANIIKNIDIDLKFSKLNILQGESSQFVIEKKTSNLTNENMQLFNHTKNDTLFVSEYSKKNKTSNKSINEITIYTPSNVKMENLNINLGKGDVGIQKTNFKKIVLNSHEVNLKLEALSFGELLMYGKSGNLEFKNVVGNQVVQNSDYGKFLSLDSTITDSNNDFKKKGFIELNDSTISNFQLKGKKNNIILKLNPLINYNIFSKNAINNTNFTKKDNTFNYIKEENTLILNWNLNETKIKEIEFIQ